MESRNKLTMCRLCLCENECYVNVFELNDLQGFIAAEVITDLLQFVVSETDGYPHVVCSKCLVKLTDFKLFRECCQKSMVKYDHMFVSSKMLEEHQPETLECVTVKAEPIFSSDNVDNVSKAIVKPEEVIINSSPDEASKDPFEETETVDEATVPRTSDYSSATADPTSANAEGNSSDMISSEITIKEEPLEVQHTAVDMETHSHYLQSFEHDTHISTYKGGVGAHLCTRNITTNDESIFENSKNISLNVTIDASSSGRIDRLERLRISPGEMVHTRPFIQDDVVVNLEVDGGKKEKDMGGEMEEGTGAAPKKGLEGERKLLECFHCGSMLMTKSSLIKHMNLHGFGHSYDCNICGKALNSKHGLKRHALVHADSTRYKCEECSKCFTQNSNLQRHMRLHTGSKPYKCTECSKCFSQNGSLTQHMKIHSGSKPYKCSVCSKCFSQNGYLKKHMKLHSGSRPYKCVECSKSFSDNCKLTQHKKRHSGSKPYKCADCSKCFLLNAELKKHMRSHTGFKPYKCEDCSKCFKQNCDLKVHIRIHTGSKPYKCGTCSKGYICSGHLKKHLLVHTKEKPFECHGCGTRFSQRGNLKKHLERYCKVGIE